MRPYGFQSEPGRRRSAMRKSMTRRRSSTPPSSKSARHRGPTSGSCSTRIGVMARSSGTTKTTPAPAQPRARQRSDEGRGGEGYVTICGARLGGGRAEHAEALAGAARADRAAAEVGAVGLPREGKGRGLGFWEQRSWRRGKGEGATCSHWRKDSSLASSAASAAMGGVR